MTHARQREQTTLTRGRQRRPLLHTQHNTRPVSLSLSCPTTHHHTHAHTHRHTHTHHTHADTHTLREQTTLTKPSSSVEEDVNGDPYYTHNTTHALSPSLSLVPVSTTHHHTHAHTHRHTHSIRTRTHTRQREQTTLMKRSSIAWKRTSTETLTRAASSASRPSASTTR